MGAYKAVNSVFAMPARIGFTLVLLAFPFLAGMAAASPWYIAAIFPVFIMADVLGKWRLQFKGNPAALKKFLPGALIAQPIVVGVIYLLGRGIGSLFSNPQTFDFGALISWPLMAVYAVVILMTGLALLYLERGKQSIDEMAQEVMREHMPESMKPRAPGPAERITIETFYTGHHHSHYDVDDETDTRTLNEQSAYLSESQIDEAESRLEVRLPAVLRALYQKQNGGFVRNILSGDVEAPDDSHPDPFGGYDELMPIDRLRSLHGSVGDYAYEDQVEMFPRESKKMIVIAQWYRNILFLDYRDGRAEPRVGYYDFDMSEDLSNDAWEQDATFWDDFDTFFATLYRQEH